MKRWEAVKVVVLYDGEEIEARRIGGRHQTHWECPCGHLFGPAERGQLCMACGSEVVQVTEAHV